MGTHEDGALASRPRADTRPGTAGAGNLGAATAAGLAAAVAGAVIWAAVTAITEYQIGFMAVGVGFLVGLAVRRFGNGSSSIFGMVGATLALLGCALGNLLTMAWFVAAQESVPYADVLTGLNGRFALELMQAGFAPMDLLFYAIAAYCGYRYALAVGEKAP